MKRIYFLGICGTAMGNVALLLKEAGFEVDGVDKQAYPPMSHVLQEAGIEVRLGFDAERLAKLAPSLVVVGNSIVRGNPEMEWLLSHRKIPYVSLPQLIESHFLRGRENIVVTGTHGKTTTATIVAALLRAAGRDPGFLIGGIPLNLPGGAHIGELADSFVIEGDEYDSAFFDKRSKFIHYPPKVAVINNIEFDHADIFRDLADVQRSFNHFLKILPQEGHLVINGDDENIAALDPIRWGRTWRVGCGEKNELIISGFQEDASGSEFVLHWQGKEWGRVRWGLGGFYNVRNAAMGALSAGLSLYPNDPTQLPLNGLEGFQGVRRRQEKLLEKNGLLVIEDFGHHPSAIRQILSSQRACYPGKRRIAAFEPRSNTTRRRVVQEELVAALGEADVAYIGPIDRLTQLAEEERLDVLSVVEELRKRGVMACHYASNKELLQALLLHRREAPGTEEAVVTFFTNGSFDGIMREFVETMRGKG